MMKFTSFIPVSYTHLDVYKRQTVGNVLHSPVSHPKIYAPLSPSDYVPSSSRSFDGVSPVSYTHLGDADEKNDGNYKIIKTYETSQYKCTFRTAELLSLIHI